MLLTVVGYVLAVFAPELVWIIAKPGAHVVSWILDWPLMQEGALLCYVLGFYLTTLVVGGLLGATFAHAWSTPTSAEARAERAT